MKSCKQRLITKENIVTYAYFIIKLKPALNLCAVAIKLLKVSIMIKLAIAVTE